MVSLNGDIQTLGGFTPSVRRGGYHIIPPVTSHASEDICCSDVIGITTVVTGDTAKVLFDPVFFGHQPTSRASTRSVSRVNIDKTHTVLLCKLLDPVQHLSVCPWGHRLTRLVRGFLLGLSSEFESGEVFNSNPLGEDPRDLFQFRVDVLLASGLRSGFALAARFLPLHCVAYGLEVRPVESGRLAVRGSSQFPVASVQTEVNTEGFLRHVWYFDVQHNVIVTKNTTVFQPGTIHRQPLAQDTVSVNRDDDRGSFDHSREIYCIIKAVTLKRLDLGAEFRDTNTTGDVWERAGVSSSLGGFLGGNHGFQGHRKAVRTLTVAQAASCVPVQGLGIQPAGISPDRTTIKVDRCTVLTKDSMNGCQLGVGEIGQRKLDGSDHDSLFSSYFSSVESQTISPVSTSTTRTCCPAGSSTPSIAVATASDRCSKVLKNSLDGNQSLSSLYSDLRMYDIDVFRVTRF